MNLHIIDLFGPYVIAAISNAIACTELILLLQYFCGGHLDISGKRLYLLFPSYFLVLFITNIFIPIPSLYMIMVLAMVYLTILGLSSLKLTDVLLTIPTFFLYTVFSIMPSYIFTTVFPYVDDSFSCFYLTLKLSDVITDLTIMLILVTIHIISQKKGLVFHITLREIALAMILFCLTMLILALCTMLFATSDYLDCADMFWRFFLPIAYVSCIVFYIYSLFEKRIRLENETLARIHMTYLQTQLDAMQNLQLQEDEIRKKRHDLKKHMAIIETLAEDGNYNEIKKYTKDLTASLPAAPVPISGNNIADIILTSRMEIANKKGITFGYEGSLAGLTDMPAPDICSILANALDNALEACENIENPYINVKAVRTRNFTTISVVNPVLVQRHIRGNLISTTKKDKVSHGYGLKIIQELAGKYHGKCLISCSKVEFSLRVQLQNP